MKDLSILSDEELITEYRDGDLPAADILMVRYKDMVKSVKDFAKECEQGFMQF